MLMITDKDKSLHWSSENGIALERLKHLDAAKQDLLLIGFTYLTIATAVSALSMSFLKTYYDYYVQHAWLWYQAYELR